MGSSVKLGISWDGSTRYLDVHPLTREDVKRLGSLNLTYGEMNSPYSTFGRSTRRFKLDKPCLGTGRGKANLKKKKIQEMYAASWVCQCSPCKEDLKSIYLELTGC